VGPRGRSSAQPSPGFIAGDASVFVEEDRHDRGDKQASDILFAINLDHYILQFIIVGQNLIPQITKFLCLGERMWF
jgi:hypothetical protein